MIAVGSYGTSIGTNFIQEYDPSTDSWRLLKNMPIKPASMTGEKVGDFVYLIGGYLNSRDLDEPLSEVWRFNLDSLKALISVTGISLDKETLEIDGPEPDTLFHSVSPADASDPSVSWTSADTDIATVADGIVTGISDGQTYIYVTTTDGNFKDSCHVSVIVGITNTNVGRLSIFPNPTNGSLTIETNQPDHHSIEIISLSGQVIYRTEMEGRSKQIDLSPFSKGIYFITIRSKDFVTTSKIIKL